MVRHAPLDSWYGGPSSPSLEQITETVRSAQATDALLAAAALSDMMPTDLGSESGTSVESATEEMPQTAMDDQVAYNG